jgi:hypothetical protein
MTIVRGLLGFILACPAAAATLILFVYTPADLAGLPSDIGADRLSEASLFALSVTPHVMMFAALPALIGIVFAERNDIAGLPFYVLVGIAIAALGFLTQHFSEAPGQATILQNYALIAFLTAGTVAGLVYWLFSGRYAAPPQTTPLATPPAEASPPTPTPATPTAPAAPAAE